MIGTSNDPVMPSFVTSEGISPQVCSVKPYIASPPSLLILLPHPILIPYNSSSFFSCTIALLDSINYLQCETHQVQVRCHSVPSVQSQSAHVDTCQTTNRHALFEALLLQLLLILPPPSTSSSYSSTTSHPSSLLLCHNQPTVPNVS